jgi:hypothetical protein
VSTIATRPVARVTRAWAFAAALAAIVTVLALVLASGGSSGNIVPAQQPLAQPQYMGGHAEFRAPQTAVDPLGQHPGQRP